MNDQMMEDAQVLMAEAEAMRQELVAMANSGQPYDTAEFDALHTAYGLKFMEASAAVGDASNAE